MTAAAGPSPVDPAMEAAYNCRAAVPEHPAIFSRWAERGATVRARAGDTLRRNVPYGEGNRRSLDLFGAHPRRRPRPLLIFLHGGYWQAMDKSTASFLAPPFLEAGAAVAIPDYPLCPTEPLRNIIGAVREAVLFLWRQAPALGLDRHRFVVAGHSAGGHLVAELLATPWPRLDSTMPVDALKGGLAISGLFDLRPLIHTSINGALGLDGPTAERLSPLFRPPAPGASLTLAVGALESAAFHDQSARLAQRWAAQGAQLTWIPLPGRHHFSALEALATPRERLHHDALGRLGVAPAPDPAG